MVIEKWNVMESLYMTVITITTVGFREVRDVSGTGRIFTVIILFSEMGIMAYILGMVAQVMVEFQIRSLIERKKLELII